MASTPPPPRPRLSSCLPGCPRVVDAFQQAPLETLCRKFLAGRDARDKQERERVELETVLAFDIILEVISSVYLLEPFRPKEVRAVLFYHLLFDSLLFRALLGLLCVHLPTHWPPCVVGGISHFPVRLAFFALYVGTHPCGR